MPRALEEPGERVAVRREPAVADVERPGRVRGHELDHHPLAVAEVGLGVAVDARLDDVAEHLVEPRVTQAEVDESGARDLDGLDVRELRRVKRRGEL